MFLKEALFARTPIPLVAKSLDACTLRSRAIANNMANLTTPGYERIEVAFEESLKAALDEKRIKGETSRQNHLPLGRPELDQLKPVAFRSKIPHFLVRSIT